MRPRLLLLLVWWPTLAGAQADVPPSEKMTPRERVENAIFDVTSGVMRPWNLLLQKLDGGVYRYRGIGFDAVIRRDGSVAYRDKSGAHLRVVQTSTKPPREGDPEIPPAPLAGIGFEPLNGDVHAVERRQFLERTRALREQLRDAHEQTARAKADRALALKLARVSRARTSAAAIQDALFALWAECADDEVGAIARAQIERFVRERCVGDEPCAFDAAALARVNEGRPDGARFEPYRDDTPQAK